MSGQAFESEALDQLQNSFKRLEVELKDKEYRNLAKKSFQCATKCCINSEANAIDSCVGECTQPLMQYQQFVQQQVQTFQERLQRCQRDCNEEIVSSLTPTTPLLILLFPPRLTRFHSKTESHILTCRSCP